MFGFRTIVVGTDFSPLSARGLSAALRLSRSQHTQRLHIVHVLPAGGVLPPFIAETLAQEAAERAMQVAQARLERLATDAPVEVTREVRLGSPARELARVADEQCADLLVVASHGGLAELVLGSVASSLIRVARCPVLVVSDRGPEPDPLSRVLAAVDLSPVSRNVLHNAVVAATTSDGIVKVLSLFEPPILRPNPDGGWLPKYIGPEELEEVAAHRHAEISALIRRSVPRNMVPIEVEVRGHPAPDGILDEANHWSADIIVVGTSGNNAWHRMILGSTTHHVLLKAACPVLVVPQEAREDVREPSESLAVSEVLDSGSGWSLP